MRLLRILALAVAGIALLAMPSASQAQVAVGISVRIGPPPLPVYVQPPCPVAGYMWIPGYWAYGPDGYYWVPGTWVPAPAPGLLWTPGYWGWGGGVYVWHAGYWGPHVGFYGGINYGFGYTGVGFVGGAWRSGHYYYNRSVTNVNVTVIHNTYNERVVTRESSRVSFNGGEGGIVARPTREQITAEHERRFGPTAIQTQHREAAGKDRGMWASENHGRPSVAASPRAGEFNGRGVVRANEERPRSDRPPSANMPHESNRPVAHNDRPPNARNEVRNEAQPNRNYANQPNPAHNNVRYAERPNTNQPRPENNAQHSNKTYSNAPKPEHENVQHAEHPPSHENQNKPKTENKPPEHAQDKPHHR
ncbi:MAG TPA: hypothetical protein VLV88_08345 [Terriglobales bacterium]|nr:hypothetical protein [Terriglobales bacterium]